MSEKQVSYEREHLAMYEHECGLIRVQALHQGEQMLDRIEARLGPATRLLALVRSRQVALAPMVERDIERAIKDARDLLGVGRA